MNIKHHFLSIVLVILLLVMPVGSGFAQEPTSKVDLTELELPIGLHLEAEEAGYEITRVVPNSLADRTNLQKGDVITAINGRPLNFMSLLTLAFKAQVNPADVTLQIIRNGQEREIALAVAPRLSLPFLMDILNHHARQNTAQDHISQRLQRLAD